MNNLTIRLETEKDYRTVEELTREAFWYVYKPGADEHYYVHQMRKHPDFIPEFAFVLELDGKIVGNIMYTKAWLKDENGKRKEILSFGPLCVAPEYQRQKFGKMLIEHSFEVARKMGYDVNINFGNPGNYVSRVFVSCKKKNVSFVVEGNFPTALLVCELVPGTLDGRSTTFVSTGSNTSIILDFPYIMDVFQIMDFSFVHYLNNVHKMFCQVFSQNRVFFAI